MSLLSDWRARRSEGRRYAPLRHLDPHILRDIGVTPPAGWSVRPNLLSHHL